MLAIYTMATIGSGISKEMIERMLQRFKRHDMLATSVVNGERLSFYGFIDMEQIMKTEGVVESEIEDFIASLERLTDEDIYGVHEFASHEILIRKEVKD